MAVRALALVDRRVPVLDSADLSLFVVLVALQVKVRHWSIPFVFSFVNARNIPLRSHDGPVVFLGRHEVKDARVSPPSASHWIDRRHVYELLLQMEMWSVSSWLPIPISFV